MGRITIPCHYCPEGETVKHAVASTKVHVIEEDTFDELMHDLRRFFGCGKQRMNLRDAGGAIWPPTHQVAHDFRGGDEVIRLVKESALDQDESVEEEEEAKPEDDDMALNFAEGGRSHRKPLLRELFLHVLFTALLLCKLFIVMDSSYAYQMASTIKEQFVQRKTVTTGKTFREMSNFRDLTEWLDDNYVNGLIASDTDSSGSAFGLNRLVGGIEYHFTHVAMTAPNVSAYSPGGVLYEGTSGFAKTLWREGDQTHVQMWHVDPIPGRPNVIDYALNATSPPTIVPGQLRERNAYIKENWLRQPEDNDGAVGWGCGCFSLMRELRLRFTLYNPDVELYTFCEFKFRQTEEGLLQPSSMLKPFPVIAPWSGLPSKKPAQMYRSLSVCILVLFNLLVLLNTRNLFKAAARAKRHTGSYRFFFLNGWNLMFVASNVLNYCNLALIIYYSHMPQRRDYDPTAITGYVDLSRVAFVFSYIKFISALCMLWAWILFIHFFELAPQTTMWYVTSSTLSRAGAAVNSAVFLFMLLMLGFSVLANNVWGLRLLNFSTVFRTLRSLVALLMGDASVYLEMTTSRPNLGALIFLMVFLAAFYFIVLPLFLAIMTDSYFVRQQINQELKAVLQDKAAAKHAQQLEDAKRKRGGLR